VAIGVDIPIGLMFTGQRAADVAARRFMPGKGSSVFPAPHPEMRYERVYREALERSKMLIGKGLSRQAFAILPKIAEVNDYLTPELQGRIFEVHPEVSFTALNGGIPLKSRKSTAAGFDERRALLTARSGLAPVPDRKLASKIAPGKRVDADDTLDAIVAAWTTRRVAEKIAQSLPAEPEIGFRGLRAQIFY
jgi:predicted RNase H-like nuclease